MSKYGFGPGDEDEDEDDFTGQEDDDIRFESDLENRINELDYEENIDDSDDSPSDWR